MAQLQTEKYLAGTVNPLLEKYRDELGYSAEVKV